MNSFSKIAIGLCAATLWGCAHEPPILIDARAQYEHSRQTETAALAPTELYDARKSLDAANSTFESDGDVQAVRDHAYIAIRKVELADSRARTASHQKSIASANAAGVKLRDAQVANAQGALKKTREQLDQERTAAAAHAQDLQRTADDANKELAQTSVQLEQEKQARQSAETRLQAAMKDLGEVAKVKEESRGVVITLSGGVLFPSGSANLLQSAQLQLDRVADALKAEGPSRRITIEGHTDSRGNALTNQVLSTRRAESVRDYLLSRGVPSEQVTAVGYGSTRPLVGNDTAENRANNRRVEIIVAPAPVSVR